MPNTTFSKTPMSVKQAVEFTGFSRGYIYKLISLGKIPSYKPCNVRQGKVFLAREDLQAYIFGAGKTDKAAGVLND